MSHQALLEYVRKAKEGGASHADISARLCSAGWYNVDVHDALELYEKITPQPQLATVRRATRSRFHSYDPRLVATAAISFIIAFLGFLWLTHY